MVNTEAFFEDIQHKINELLLSAETEIVLAVAWFTDKELFQTLRRKAAEGIRVQLAINNDAINNKTSGVVYEQLSQVGGEVHKIKAMSKGQLMHHKFCVIDRKTVITGSYNWSKQAQKNHENIVVSHPAPELASQFILAFGDLLTNNKIHSTWLQTLEADSGQLLKRLSLVKQFIELGDYDDINGQMSKLRASGIDSNLSNILTALDEQQYAVAIPLIDQYIKEKTAIVVYVDPAVAQLEREILVMELQLQAIEEQIAEVTRLIYTFQQQYFEELGDLLEEYLSLKAEQKKEQAEAAKQQQASDSKKAQAEYEKAQADSEEFRQRSAEAELQPSAKHLTKEETKELKTLFRKAAQKCHPDKVPEEQKEAAQQCFVALQEAHQQNDLEKVRQIWNQLETMGTFDISDSSQKDMSLEQLQVRLASLKSTLAEKMAELEALTGTDSYEQLCKLDDWSDYFSQEKELLINSILELKDNKQQVANG